MESVRFEPVLKEELPFLNYNIGSTSYQPTVYCQEKQILSLRLVTRSVPSKVKYIFVHVSTLHGLHSTPCECIYEFFKSRRGMSVNCTVSVYSL